MKLNIETPYIVNLYLDSNSHLIVDKSDGTKLDVGYLPTHSINIHYTNSKWEENDDENILGANPPTNL